jgi:mono/diheme cytochrome c family protein
LRIALTLGLALGAVLACSWVAAPAPETPGADLARRLGCLACHAPAGSPPGPAIPLAGVGARLTPTQLRLALTLPRRLHPRAKMPSYAYLPPPEQEALVRYLESLK